MDDKTLKNKTVSGFFWKICERVAAQAVSFVVTIVLARLLMPADYAPITLLTIFIAFANIFISDGFCAALVQKKDVDELDYSSVLISGFVFSIAIYLVLFVSSPIVANFYDMPIITPALRVLALRIPLASINSVEIAYLTKNLRFRSFFWGTFIGTLASAAVGISCALKGFGTWSLVAQNLTNYTIDTIVLAIIIHRIPKLRFSIQRVKPLIQYGYKILLTNIVFTVTEHLRSLIIGKKYSANDLSFYSKGHQFPQLVSNVITAPMTSVLFPTMSVINDDIGKVKAVFRRSVQILSYVISPIMLGIAGISSNLIPLLLTEKWNMSIPFVCIFCVYYLFPPVHSLNLEAVKAIGRSDEVLKYGIIKRVISIVTLVISLFFNVYVIAISTIFSASLASVVNAYQNRKMFNYSYREQLIDWIPNLIISGLMFCAVWLVGNLLHYHYLINICIQVSVGIVAFLGLSICTKNPSLPYIAIYIKDILRKKRGIH